MDLREDRGGRAEHQCDHSGGGEGHGMQSFGHSVP